MSKRSAIISLIAVAAALAVAASALSVVAVEGASMMPALQSGQFVLAFKPRNLLRPLRRGDVVLVRRGQEILIKRVAYLPGDRIAPLDRLVFEGVSDFFDVGPKPRTASNASLRVPDGRVVVLGDNRAHSDDSRRFGPVPLRDIAGRVLFVR